MDTEYNFKKEWEKTKKQLKQLSADALELAQKGEKELIKISRKSKWHIDSTAITLKRDRLYFLIGKAYAKIKKNSVRTKELDRLMKELQTLEKEEKDLQKKMKRVQGH